MRLLAGGVPRDRSRRPFYRHDIVEQFDAIGVQSLTVVLLTGFFTGAVLALQSGLTLDQFGARPVVGRLVSASMIKELGPVLTGLMLTGRVGSGIAAELGSMVVTDQINALRALGTDPIRKLVVPAHAGRHPHGAGPDGHRRLRRHRRRLDRRAFPAAGVDRAVLVVDPPGAVHEDVWMGLIKPFVLGFVIVSIACHVGLRRAAERRAWAGDDDAVVAGSVGVIAVDFFVTSILISLPCTSDAAVTRSRHASSARRVA